MKKINTICLVLVILFTFNVQPVDAGFFDWFSWTKIKSLFRKSEPLSEPPMETLEEIPQETSQGTVPESSKEIIKEVIKEVPVEKIVIQEIIKEIPIEKVITETITETITEIVENIIEVPANCLDCLTCPICPDNQSLISSLRNQISSLQNQISSLQSQIQSLNTEIENLRNPQTEPQTTGNIDVLEYITVTRDNFPPDWNLICIISGSQKVGRFVILNRTDSDILFDSFSFSNKISGLLTSEKYIDYKKANGEYVNRIYVYHADTDSTVNRLAEFILSQPEVSNREDTYVEILYENTFYVDNLNETIPQNGYLRFDIGLEFIGAPNGCVTFSEVRLNEDFNFDSSAQIFYEE